MVRPNMIEYVRKLISISGGAVSGINAHVYLCIVAGRTGNSDPACTIVDIIC